MAEDNIKEQQQTAVDYNDDNTLVVWVMVRYQRTVSMCC